jgi:hypothetical protein
VAVEEKARHEQKNEATGSDSSANQKRLQGYLGPVRENQWPERAGPEPEPEQMEDTREDWLRVPR